MAWNTGFCAFDSLSTALFPLYDLFGIIDQSRDDVTKNPLTCLGLSCALWGCAAVDPDPSQVSNSYSKSYPPSACRLSFNCL